MNAMTFPSWVIRQLERYRKLPTLYARNRSTLHQQAGSDSDASIGSESLGASAPQSNWTVKIFRSLTEIGQSDWDSIVAPGSLLKTHAYLRAVETSGIENVRYYYPTVTNLSGELIAHACVYVIDTDLSQLLPARLGWMTKLLRRLWKRFLIVKVTECAAPLSTGNSISFERQSDPPLLVSCIAEAIESISHQERSRLIVIRDFLEDERGEFNALLDKGYKLVSNMPLARIHVRWNTYEDYLMAMRARYRTDVKRRIRRAQASGQSVRVLMHFGERADLWAAQARTVQSKTKGFKREVLAPGYYESMDRVLGEKSMLVIAEREGKTVAHGMLLQDRVTTTATYFGRNCGPAQHEWFQLVNEVIRLGIENRSKYINLGLGSYDAKMNVGAQVEPLFVYTKSSFAALNWLMCRIPQTMNRSHPTEKQIFHEATAERA
jgi:predicted N-acyltransferase